MEDKQLKTRDIAERYGVSESTARRYMHEMGCMEKPLRVWLSAVIKWDKKRSRPPVDYLKALATNERLKRFRSLQLKGARR